VNNFDKKVIFNYKGLDIKLLNINLLNCIELDFLFTARFGWNLSFPCSFLRKIQKTFKNPSNIAPLLVQRWGSPQGPLPWWIPPHKLHTQRLWMSNGSEQQCSAKIFFSLGHLFLATMVWAAFSCHGAKG